MKKITIVTAGIMFVLAIAARMSVWAAAGGGGGGDDSYSGHFANDDYTIIRVSGDELITGVAGADGKVKAISKQRLSDVVTMEGMDMGYMSGNQAQSSTQGGYMGGSHD